jgi:hypothetical protein
LPKTHIAAQARENVLLTFGREQGAGVWYQQSRAVCLLSGVLAVLSDASDKDGRKRVWKFCEFSAGLRIQEELNLILGGFAGTALG